MLLQTTPVYAAGHSLSTPDGLCHFQRAQMQSAKMWAFDRFTLIYAFPLKASQCVTKSALWKQKVTHVLKWKQKVTSPKWPYLCVIVTIKCSSMGWKNA